jgi:hypothetical protein
MAELGTSETSVHVIECPVCHQPITGQLSVALAAGAITTGAKGAEIPVTAKITGIHVEHDCRPKTTRSEPLRPEPTRPSPARRPDGTR